MPSDGSDRGYGLEDYRLDHRGDRGLSSSVNLMDHMDPSRCDMRPGSPPLPPSSLPHECQVCGKLISCRRNLWKHMERVHLTNPAVRCSICAKLFKNKYALKDHQRIYHGGLSEPLHASAIPHHQSPANLLSRILRDARPSCPPPGPVSLSRPSCSIISVSPTGHMDGRPPRELAPIPHAISHPSMDSLPPYRRRMREEDDPGSSVGPPPPPPPYGNMEGPPLLPPPPLPPSSSLHVSGSPVTSRPMHVSGSPVNSRRGDGHGNSSSSSSMLRPS